jgi:hypothetical protein
LQTLPITNYSVLKGDPRPGKVTGFHPHFRIPVQTDSGPFTIDINVQSFNNSEVLYSIIQNFTPPDAASLLAMPRASRLFRVNLTGWASTTFATPPVVLPSLPGAQ